jgi:predicted enzyme related to lactoylglutathione lyase
MKASPNDISATRVTSPPHLSGLALAFVALVGITTALLAQTLGAREFVAVIVSALSVGIAIPVLHYYARAPLLKPAAATRSMIEVVEPNIVEPSAALVGTSLAAADPEAAARFYAELLKTSISPFRTLLAETNNRSRDWLPIVKVRDVAQVAAAVPRLGGSVIMEPNVSAEGYLAVIVDPAGAAMAAWQPAVTRESSGVKHLQIRGIELVAPEALKSSAFYNRLFGWQIAASTDKRVSLSFSASDANVALFGVRKIDDVTTWLTYFDVEDFAGATAQAQQLGGQIVIGPTGLPNGRQIVVLRDERAGLFGLIG